jgi:hypothetical protein
LTVYHVRHITSSSSWRPASADNREPIVPHGGAEERIAFPRGEGEAPTKGVIEIARVRHIATGYKRSVALARHGALR